MVLAEDKKPDIVSMVLAEAKPDIVSMVLAEDKKPDSVSMVLAEAKPDSVSMVLADDKKPDIVSMILAEDKKGHSPPMKNKRGASQKEKPVIMAPVVVADAPVVVADAPVVVADAPVVVADAPVVVADAPVVVEEVVENIPEIQIQSNDNVALLEENENLNIKIKEIAEEIKREKSDLEHVLNKEFTINHIMSDFYQLEKDIEKTIKKTTEIKVETNVEKDLRKTYKTNFQHNNTNYSINTIKLDPLPKDSNIMKIDVSENNIINTSSLAFEIDSSDMNYLILYNNIRYLINKTGNLIVIINLYNKNIQKIKNKDSIKMMNNDYMLYNNTVFIPMENKKIFNNDYGTSFNLFTPKI